MNLKTLINIASKGFDLRLNIFLSKKMVKNIEKQESVSGEIGDQIK